MTRSVEVRAASQSQKYARNRINEARRALQKARSKAVRLHQKFLKADAERMQALNEEERARHDLEECLSIYAKQGGRAKDLIEGGFQW